jgi:outer membrane protein assembly complex protein YaeT
MLCKVCDFPLRLVAALTLIGWSFAGARAALALTVGDLDPSVQYRTGRIAFSGDHALSEEELLAQLNVRQRPWYMPWKTRPAFEPDDFAIGIRNLRLLYQMHGYYNARITYDLSVHDRIVDAKIRIDEGRPAIVRRVSVKIDGYSPPPGVPPVSLVPLKPGDVFTEEAYQKGEQVLRTFFANAGYARVSSKRRAEVDVASASARVWYTVHAGSQAVFGPTRLTGARRVSPRVIRRELTYRKGEKFSEARLGESRDRLLALNLFSSVNLVPDLESAGSEIPVDLSVHERPARTLQIGGGYSTQDDMGGQLQWTDYNWLGDGRQMSVLLRYAAINSAANASLTQPFLFGVRGLQGVAQAGLLRDDEQTFLLNAPQFAPSVAYIINEQLTVSLGYQLMYGRVNNVNSSVVTALGGILRKGVVSGPALGLTWNTSNDPFYPTQGGIVMLHAMESSGIFGSNYSFYRATLEGRRYTLIGEGTVLATRLKVGLADSLGSKIDYPIFERFFPGGQGSVRGYGRWRLGPLSASNDPLGGLSDIEGSLELRHHVWGKLSGAVFVDFGQASLHSYDLPVSDLQFGFGPALMYQTPVGPLRVDLGIPSKTPRGDQSWQIYFSVGQFF